MTISSTGQVWPKPNCVKRSTMNSVPPVMPVIWKLVTKAESVELGVITSPDDRQIVAYGKLSGPNWYLLLTYPKAAVKFNGGALEGLTAKAPKTAAPAEGSFEIVLAGDDPRLPIHQDMVAPGGLNVEDHRPSLPVRVARPVVVRDDDLPALGVAARRDEGRAMTFGQNMRRIDRVLPLVQPRDVILG